MAGKRDDAQLIHRSSSDGGQLDWSASGPIPAAATELDLAEENAALKAELSALQARLLDESAGAEEAVWPTKLDYDEQAVPAGKLLSQLAGVSKERMKAGRIRNSDEFDYLPKPTADEAVLEADFIRWGCALHCHLRRVVVVAD